MDLLVATTNKGKIEEIEALFRDSGLDLKLYSLADLNIDKDCPETGATFLANATEKALYYSGLADKIEDGEYRDMYVVADDSGLTVEALAGQPGVHSARFAGLPCNDDNNTAKLLGLLENETNRTAAFVTVAALAKNGTVIHACRGRAEGTILTEKRGDLGFGYDPVFFYPPLQKTFAQLTTEEKNEISHRARAFKKLKAFLLQINAN